MLEFSLRAASETGESAWGEPSRATLGGGLRPAELPAPTAWSTSSASASVEWDAGCACPPRLQLQVRHGKGSEGEWHAVASAPAPSRAGGESPVCRAEIHSLRCPDGCRVRAVVDGAAIAGWPESSPSPPSEVFVTRKPSVVPPGALRAEVSLRGPLPPRAHDASAWRSDLVSALSASGREVPAEQISVVDIYGGGLVCVVDVLLGARWRRPELVLAELAQLVEAHRSGTPSDGSILAAADAAVGVVVVDAVAAGRRGGARRVQPDGSVVELAPDEVARLASVAVDAQPVGGGAHGGGGGGGHGGGGGGHGGGGRRWATLRSMQIAAGMAAVWALGAWWWRRRGGDPRADAFRYDVVNP